MEPLKVTPEGMAGDKKKNQNIQVFVRVRPMNSQENAKHTPSIIDTPGTREVVVRHAQATSTSKTFTFDRVFGALSKQVDVYKTVVAPLLTEVLLGYNCTVFAYGQTGTGKTFTMEGERMKKDGTSVEIDPQAGILPRALSQLFDEVRMMNCEFSIRVSFLELYNEELFDLLAPIEESKTRTLRLYEDSNRKGSVIIQGLEEVIVNNKQEVYNVLDRGSQQRKTAATLMNAHSSRSHTVFTITVHLKESTVEGEEMVKIGKLNLVDLAGSENIGKSGAIEKRAREAGNINQSLLTLGRVISALVERAPHIPYRESKLTRLLQDSLGGKTKTSIIATVSPAQCNMEETLSTLDYAHRAKNIMNKPEVNQKMTKKEALNIYCDEIERLRKDLNAAREKNGIYMDTDNYHRQITQIQAQHAELNEKSNKIKQLEDYLMEKEKEIEETSKFVEELQRDKALKQLLLDQEKRDHEKTKLQLAVATKDGDELKYLVKYHQGKGTLMNEEAQSLLSTASDTLKTVDQLHSRLERKQGIEERNWSNSKRFRGDFHRAVDDLIQIVDQLRAGHTLSVTKIRDSYDTRNTDRKAWLDAFFSSLTQGISLLEQSNKSSQNSLSNLIENLSKLAENANAKTKESTEQNHATFCNSVQNIVDGIATMKSELAVVNQENVNVGKAISDKFNHLRANFSKHFLENVGLFDKVAKSLNVLKDTYAQCLEQNMERYSKFQKEKEANEVSMNKDFQNIFSEMEAMRAKMNAIQGNVEALKAKRTSELKHVEDTFSSVINSYKTATENAEPVIVASCNIMDKASSQQNQMNEDLSSYNEQAVTNHVKALQEINEKLACTQKETLENFEKTVTGSLADHRSSVNSLHNDVVGRTHEFMNTFNDFADRSKRELDAQSDQVTLTEKTCCESIQNLVTVEAAHSSEIVDTINEQCDIVSKGTTKVNSALQQAAGNVDEFWEQTYLHDTPSGGSPMRRRYELPAKLTQPSPHSRVMSRYRAVSKRVESIINEGSGSIPSPSSTSGIMDRSWSETFFDNLPVPEFPDEPTRSEPIVEETEDENEAANMENECPEPEREIVSQPVPEEPVFEVPKAPEPKPEFQTPRMKEITPKHLKQGNGSSSVGKSKLKKKNKPILKAPN